MISSGSSPVRFSSGSRFSASSTASPPAYTLSPKVPGSLMPNSVPDRPSPLTGRAAAGRRGFTDPLPGERDDAPGAGPGTAGSQDDQPGAGVERVRCAGHRLDRD